MAGVAAKESQFMRKLVQILEQEDAALVRWSADGRTFTILDTARFQRVIKTKYRLGSLCTFRMNLRAHAFVEFADGDVSETSGAVDSSSTSGTATDEEVPPSETYYHPFFVRGRPELLERIMFEPTMKFRCPECRNHPSKNGAKCASHRRDSESTDLPSLPAPASTVVSAPVPVAVPVPSTPAASNVAAGVGGAAALAGAAQTRRGAKRANHVTRATAGKSLSAMVAKMRQRASATTATIDASATAAPAGESGSAVGKPAPLRSSARVSSVSSTPSTSNLSSEVAIQGRSVPVLDSRTGSGSDIGAQPSGGLSRRTESGRDDSRVCVDGVVVGRTTDGSGAMTTTTATTTTTGPNSASASALASNAKTSTPGQESLKRRVSFERGAKGDNSSGVTLRSGVTSAPGSAEGAAQQSSTGLSTLEASANQPDGSVIAAVTGALNVSHLHQQLQQQQLQDRYRPLVPAIASRRSHNERVPPTVTSTRTPGGIGIMHPRDVDNEPMANSSEVSASGSEQRGFHSRDGEVRHQPQPQQPHSHDQHQPSHCTSDADSQQRQQPQQPDERQFLHHDLQRRLQLQQQQQQNQLLSQLQQERARHPELQSPLPPIVAPPRRSIVQSSLPVSEVSSQPRTDASEPPSAGVAMSGTSTKRAYSKRRAVKKSNGGAVPKKILPKALSATAALSAFLVASSELMVRQSKSSSLSVLSQERRESEEVPASARTTTATTKTTKKSASATSSQLANLTTTSMPISISAGLERERPGAVQLTIRRKPKPVATEESTLAAALATPWGGSGERVSTVVATRQLASLSVRLPVQPSMRITLSLHRDSRVRMRDVGSRASSATVSVPVSSVVVTLVPVLGSSSRSHASVATSRVGSAGLNLGQSSTLLQGSEATALSSSAVSGGASGKRASVGAGLERERPAAVRLTIRKKPVATDDSTLAANLVTQSSGLGERVSTAVATRQLASLSMTPSLRPMMRITLALRRDSRVRLRDVGSRASVATVTAPVSSVVVTLVPALGSSSRSHASVATSRVESAASRFGQSSALPQGSEAAVRSSSVVGGGAPSRRHSSDAREKKTNASRTFLVGKYGISQTLLTTTTTKATTATTATKATAVAGATSGRSEVTEQGMVMGQRMHATVSASSAATGGGVGGRSISPAVTAAASTTVARVAAASTTSAGARSSAGVGTGTVVGAGSVVGADSVVEGFGSKRTRAGSTAKPRGRKKRPSDDGALAAPAAPAAAVAATPAADVQAAPGSQGSQAVPGSQGSQAQAAAATSTKIRATSLKRARDEASMMSTIQFLSAMTQKPALDSSSASATAATPLTQLFSSVGLQIPRAQRRRVSTGGGTALSSSSSGN